MKFSIKNIGLIESAEVEIKGLTVIAGHNDTGKSTVGKVAYSLTKAFGTYEEWHKSKANRRVSNNLMEISSILRRSKSLGEDESLDLDYQLFKLHRYYSKNSLRGKLVKSKLIESIKTEIDKKNIEKKDEVAKLFKDIDDLFKEVPNNIKIQEAIQEILRSEFGGVINNFSSQLGRIEVSKGSNEIIQIDIEKSYIPQIDKHKKIFESFPFNDSVFIETPLVLSYDDDDFGTLVKVNHLRDLIKSLKKKPSEKDLCLNISEIIKGNLHYDEDLDDFKFINESKNEVELLNLASGIKSFGILQLLDRSGAFNENLLLIIDEPEVHLHPKWQVEYAKLLVNLAEKGRVSVLITSHSPYMVSALSKYSKTQGIENNTLFYLSKLKDGRSIIEDKTKKKKEIFDELSEPFHRLVFDE